MFDLKLFRSFGRYVDVHLNALNLLDKTIMYSSSFEGPGIEIHGGLTLRY